MDIHYRAAALADEEAMFGLAAALATSFKVNQAHFVDVYKHLLEDPNADLLLAVADSQVIGYVLAFHHYAFYANGLISWVEELFVSEAFRGHSVGKKLMLHIEKLAEARGSKLVALATRRASGFYKAIGYEETAANFRKILAKP